MKQTREERLDALNLLQLRMAFLLKEMDNVGFVSEDLGDSFNVLQDEFERFSEKVMTYVYLAGGKVTA